MQRFVPSRRYFLRLGKASVSGKPLLDLTRFVCVTLGVMEQPHDGAGFKPGGTLQYNTQPRQSKEKGDTRIWGAQG